jgi:hypothetical protein
MSKANMIRINKKQCMDDEASAYNTIQNNRDNFNRKSSVGSSQSSSSSLTLSMKKHKKNNEQLNIKVDNPFTRELQTISIPSTASSNQQYI